MKRIFYLTLALFALPFVVTSCSDDDDLPNVDYKIQISGGYMDPTDNVIYIEQGNTLTIESLGVVNLDSDKPAMINNARYYWDYIFLGDSWIQPFTFSVDVDRDTPVGDHLLSIKTQVLAVDKEVAVGIVNYTVRVVDNPDDIPGDIIPSPDTPDNPDTPAE